MRSDRWLIFNQAFVIFGLALMAKGLVWVIGGIDARAVEADAESDSDGSLYAILSLLVYAYSFFYLARNPQKTVGLVRKLPFVAWFVALSLLSVTWSVGPAETATRSLALVGTLGFSSFAYLRLGKDALLSTLTLFFVLAAGCSLLVAFALPLYGTEQYGQNAGNLRGIFANKNTAAYMCVLGLFLVWRGFQASSGLRRRMHALYLLMLLAVLSLTQSRGAFLVLLLTIAASWVVGKLARGRLSGWMGLACLSAALVVLVPAIYINWDSALAEIGRDATMSGRTTIWIPVMDFIKESPIIGHGYQAGWANDGPLRARVQNYTGWTWLPGHAHNSYLDVAAGLGLLGVALYFLQVVRSIRQGITLTKRGDASTGQMVVRLILSISLLGVTGRTIMQPNSAYMVIFSLAIILAATDISAISRSYSQNLGDKG